MNTNLEVKPIAYITLPLAFREASRQLYFEAGVAHGHSSQKTAPELRQVLRSPDDAESGDVCYDFYPGVARFADGERFATANLRYDIIVVHPGVVGGEYKKTSGHFHSSIPGSSFLYPEIYEVLQGQAIFMLQKVDSSGAVTDAIAVKADIGDKLIIPPGYGHATVNTGKEALIFSDLICADCQNTYGSIAENHGMCFYAVEDGGSPLIVPNPAYTYNAACREIRCAKQPELGICAGNDIYGTFSAHPGIFSYLTNPEPYIKQIEHLLSGRS